MKRTIEELSRKSREKESQLKKKLQQLQEKISGFSEKISTSKLDSLLSDLEKTPKKKSDLLWLPVLKESRRVLHEFLRQPGA